MNRDEIIRELYDCGPFEGVGIKFTHKSTGISIQGPCQTFTEKDELNLYNRLREAVLNSSSYDSMEEVRYCNECHRVKTT